MSEIGINHQHEFGKQLENDILCFRTKGSQNKDLQDDIEAL